MKKPFENQFSVLSSYLSEDMFCAFLSTSYDKFYIPRSFDGNNFQPKYSKNNFDFLRPENVVTAKIFGIIYIRNEHGAARTVFENDAAKRSSNTVWAAVLIPSICRLNCFFQNFIFYFKEPGNPVCQFVQFVGRPSLLHSRLHFNAV